MSKYIRNVNVEVQHDGEKIAAVLRPFKLQDLVFLRSFYETDQTKMLVEYAKMLPAYIVSITGFVDNEGKELGLEVLQDAYFVQVVTAFMTQHIEAASVKDPTQPVAQ